tara:strand:- start:2323 stop:2541 length:219 start_codon:yes stop_codon:yes gene_type:complete
MTNRANIFGFKLQWLRPSEGEWETLFHTFHHSKSLRAENKMLRSILDELIQDLKDNHTGTEYRVVENNAKDD